MLTITNVYQYVNARGIQITVLVLSNGRSVHTTAKRLAAKGISNDQIFSLIGCTINVFYFAIGDELRNGQAVTTANTIVRDFAVTKSLQMQVAGQMAAMMMQQMGVGAAPAAPTTTVAGIGQVDESTGEVVTPATNTVAEGAGAPSAEEIAAEEAEVAALAALEAEAADGK